MKMKAVDTAPRLRTKPETFVCCMLRTVGGRDFDYRPGTAPCRGPERTETHRPPSALLLETARDPFPNEGRQRLFVESQTPDVVDRSKRPLTTLKAPNEQVERLAFQ